MDGRKKWKMDEWKKKYILRRKIKRKNEKNTK